MSDEFPTRRRRRFIFRFHLENKSMVESNEMVFVNQGTDLPNPEEYPAVAQRLRLPSSASWDVVHVNLENTEDKSGILLLHIHRPPKSEHLKARMAVLARSTTSRDWVVEKYRGLLHRSYPFLTKRLGPAGRELTEKTELGEFSIIEKTLQHYNNKIFAVGAPSEGSSDLIVSNKLKNSLKPKKTFNYITQLLSEAQKCREKGWSDAHVSKYLNRLSEEALHLVEAAEVERLWRHPSRNKIAHPVPGYESIMTLIARCERWSNSLKSELEDFVNSAPHIPPEPKGDEIFPMVDTFGLRNLIEEVDELCNLLRLYKSTQSNTLEWQ